MVPTTKDVITTQTFLPYPDFAESARVLDRQRLGKQRVEVLQVMKALCDPTYGWQNHPAVKMWRGYEFWLLDYQRAICAEWRGRGYRDTCDDKTQAIFDAARLRSFTDQPRWLGFEALHLSHQSNLVRKDPEHYGPLFPGVPADLEYVWPEAVA